MAKRVFSETRMFNYHRRMKIASGLLWIFGIAVFVSVVASYAIVLRNSDSAGVAMVGAAARHIMANIVDSTLLGVFYTALIGGLFFVFTPLEVFYAKFLGSGHSMLLIFAVYMLGITISYSIDYFLGLKLSRFAKKLISPRKFYSIKGKINKYGSAAVFMFNALPLPSQILTAILGVFKYNKTRFYVFFFLGQIVKLAVITAGVYYVV